MPAPEQSHKDIDKTISDALRKELEGTILDPSREASMHEMVIDSFKGRMKWLVVINYIVVMAFFFASVYCVIQFFQTDDVRASISWLGISMFCLMAVMANKMWYFMLLNRNAVLREVKRLEIQIAQLARGID